MRDLFVSKECGAGARLVLMSMVSLGLVGCIIDLNPRFMSDTESESTRGDGDGDGVEDGDGVGDGDGDGDGDPLADDSLVAHYQFELRAEVVDDSGYGNHGVATVLGLSPGVTGMAMDCATSEAVQVPDSSSLDVSEAVTMAMWVRPESFPQSGRAAWADNSGQYAMMYDADFGLVWRVLTSDGSFQADAGARWLPLGEWTHIASTYDGAVSRIYANGEQIAILDMTGLVFADNSEPMAIGSDSPSFGQECTGRIDDLRIYNRALTSVEIATLAGP
ncbi:hypothetical protein ENSA5_57890 [Enhygromyxa salina]|uniref:LamG-like jellyroll fold domain-containing protein n=1 Tax=Enhygromyxa salina TaxID=215803 RepID=A0A2S9XE85_9BACT|nr:LamG domain-containing protein [Enhygromyxa salina]PRP91172.1 hypothetical protein ENSA5_57890 [Enhygromyxa salina]